MSLASGLLRKRRRRGKSAETYGYDMIAGFKTVGFRSNAPAGPYCPPVLHRNLPRRIDTFIKFKLKGIEIHYQIPINASAFANGGSIVVTATGNGEAYANVCGVANQAISTF